MKRKVVYFLVALFGAVMFLGASVDPSTYITQYSYYNRSDGVYQSVDTHGLTAHINGVQLNEVTKHTLYEPFTGMGDGGIACMQNDWTACSGTATEVNFVTFESGNTVGVYMTGNQTAPGVDPDAASLDIANDQANDEGMEMFYGGLLGVGGAPFIVGESAAFYACATFVIADASGTDDFQFGFRKYEPIQAAWDDYDEAATIGIVGSANPNNIYIQTILNGGATVETDTTLNWADAASKKLCVYVSAAGVVTYTVGGLPPPTTAAYTFDDNEAVIPFVKILQHSDLTGEVDMTEWKVGLQ